MTSNRKPFNIASIGRRASKALAEPASGHVLAVFKRSIHIAVADHTLCVGDFSMGDGPLNVLLSQPVDAGWTSLATTGDPVVIAESGVRLPRCTFVTTGARIWEPPAWPGAASDEGVSKAFHATTTAARMRAPIEGLSRFIILPEVASDTNNGSTLWRLARPRIETLKTWLIASFDSPSPPPFPDAALGLLGLGPGLTPSGDDVLCGAFIALHAIGKHRVAFSIAAAVLPASTSSTSRLSRCFVESAADGETSAALHGFMSATVEGDLNRLEMSLLRLANVGHTSGWDAIAGVVLVISAYADRLRQSRFLS